MSYCTKVIDSEVIKLLQIGGVGLLPTDTIYGISAVASNRKAVQKIHELKGRDKNKPFIVLIGDLRQLKDLGVNSLQEELVKKYWPAPLSVIFNKNLAVRMPANQELRILINKVGPIVSTSANPQGQEPAVSVTNAQKYFGIKLDFYVDAGELNNPPSTLVKVIGGKIKVIRKGVYKL
jgi:L-threonylcarbamoyladenylate synthase